MDLESTHGHHRLLTRREKEKRVDYLGVEARRRRREETLVRLGWTPGLDPKRRRGFWFSGGFADAPSCFSFLRGAPRVLEEEEEVVVRWPAAVDGDGPF